MLYTCRYFLQFYFTTYILVCDRAVNISLQQTHNVPHILMQEKILYQIPVFWFLDFIPFSYICNLFLYFVNVDIHVHFNQSNSTILFQLLNTVQSCKYPVYIVLVNICLCISSLKPFCLMWSNINMLLVTTKDSMYQKTKVIQKAFKNWYTKQYV